MFNLTDDSVLRSIPRYPNWEVCKGNTANEFTDHSQKPSSTIVKTLMCLYLSVVLSQCFNLLCIYVLLLCPKYLSFNSRRQYETYVEQNSLDSAGTE